MPPLIALDAIPQVATQFQNEDHAEEARLLDVATVAVAAVLAKAGPRDAAVAALDELARHTREHFAREDAAMRRTGFPPFQVHQAEHQRVLNELRAMENAFVAGGDVAALHHYLTMDVPQWFLAHIQSMDAVTANWIVAHGG